MEIVENFNLISLLAVNKYQKYIKNKSNTKSITDNKLKDKVNLFKLIQNPKNIFSLAKIYLLKSIN